MGKFCLIAPKPAVRHTERQYRQLDSIKMLMDEISALENRCTALKCVLRKQLRAYNVLPEKTKYRPYSPITFNHQLNLLANLSDVYKKK